MAPHIQQLDPAREAAELVALLAEGGVRAVYQPIVDLDSGEILAFEALARGPEGSPLESPARLFAAAAAAGRVAELDWACRGAALRGALDARLDPTIALFVNVEPSTLAVPPSPEMSELLAEAGETLNVVVEVTERSLTSSPADLLAALGYVRRFGWGVALDDVGSDISSLALMPFIRPDVVKLDLRLVQHHPDSEIAAIVAAVDAYAERAGARVLAEGIETDAHRDTATAMGASLGQGWLFARPGPLPAGITAPGRPLQPSPVPVPSTSPMDAAAAARPARRATKPLLLEMSRLLERQALANEASSVVVGAFQTADRFTPATGRRYEELARRSVLVAAMGVGMDEEPAIGVRGVGFEADDALADEWAVAVVGTHFAGALAAKDVGDRGPDQLRRFDYVLTYDRDLVVQIADSMLRRIVGA